MSSKRVLVLYYSQTGQTERVLEIVSDELRRARHQVEMVRLNPVEDFRFPWSPFALLGLMIRTYAGAKLSVALEELPSHIRTGRYDLAVIGYQPWFLTPSVPVRSFLDGPAGELLRGRHVVSVITCRSLWKRAYRTFAQKVEDRGATVVDSLVVEDPARQPMNMVTTVFHLLTGQTLDRGFLKRVFPPVGIGEGGLGQARQFGERLAARLGAGEI